VISTGYNTNGCIRFLIVVNIALTALVLCAELARRLALFVIGSTGLHGVLYFPDRVLGRGEGSVVFEGEWRPLSGVGAPPISTRTT
jgi:hypothetical protein